MNKKQCEKTMIVALVAGSLLDTHLGMSQDLMDEDEFNELRQKIGRCMGQIHTEILELIWKSNSELMPKQCGGTYQFDDSFQKKVIKLYKEFHSDFT